MPDKSEYACKGTQHYTEKDILDKSRELIHAFMNKQLLPFKNLLDENFVWVGAAVWMLLCGCCCVDAAVWMMLCG